MLGEEQGNDNAGVRLALYFERVAPTLTDAYDLLGDDALLETFRVAFGFTEDFSNMDIDMQAALVDKNLNLRHAGSGKAEEVPAAFHRHV